MNQVLDMAVVDELLSLSDDGDPELLLDLIQLFLDDGPAKIESLVQGLDEQDFDKMERAAHALKGSSGNLGAVLLQDSCEKMQEATRGKDFERSKELTPIMRSTFDEACQALRALHDRLSS